MAEAAIRHQFKNLILIARHYGMAETVHLSHDPPSLFRLEQICSPTCYPPRYREAPGLGWAQVEHILALEFVGQSQALPHGAPFFLQSKQMYQFLQLAEDLQQ